MPYEKVGKNDPVCIADEVPFEIPESWEWVRLSSVVYNHGQTKPEEDFCYIDIGSVDNQHQKLSAVETIIPPEKAPSRARKIICKGDIIYSTVRPYLHNMCIIDRNFSKMPIASTGFAVFTCHADFYNEFLFYYLMSPDFDSYANNVENSKGVAYPAINDTRLYKALIPLPPVDEQHRIVDKIKSVLPEIEKYDLVETELSNMNRDFPENLKRSILQWAVQGRLVPQDPSDEPAEVLLERIRTEKQRLVKEGKIKKDKHESIIFRRDNSHYEKLDGIERCIDDELPFEIPENWGWIRLGDIGDWSAGATPSRSHPEYYGGSIPWLKTGDLTDSYIKHIPESISDLGFSKTSVRLNPAGSVLIAMYGATIGKLGILTFPSTTNQACCACKPVHGIDTLFLFYFLLSQRTAFIKRGEGGAQPNISKEKIISTYMPLPPLSEQLKIVSKIEELFPLLKSL